MVKYVVKNILNTIHYLIKRYIKKVYLLIIMFLLGMIFQSNVFAADEGSEWIPATDILSYPGLTCDKGTLKFVNFSSFNLYYFPVVQGQKVGYYFDANGAYEYRCGFSADNPSVNGTAYQLFYGNRTYSSSDYSFIAPISGYFFFSYYPQTGGNVALYTSTDTSSILGAQTDAINNQTQVIQNQTQVIQQQTTAINNQTNTLNNSINNSTEQVVGTLTDSTIDDDSMTIDTSSFDTSGDAEVNNFMSSFLTTVYNAYTGITDDVITIDIPLPYTDNVLTLQSDLLSRYIINTPLYTLIQVFWTFVIGSYLVMFTYRIYAWLSSGKIAEKGISGFISYLDEQNELIKTYMM